MYGLFHALPQDNTPTNATTHFFDRAIIDHFGGDAGTGSTWKQRYFVDETFWCGNGCPILLLIGNEAPAGPISSYMYMYGLASKHSALMVVLEHRFYGASTPHMMDLSTRNLNFLTSEQALADLAVFLQYFCSFDPRKPDTQSSPPLRLKATTANASKVVAFGYSYGGALAAWAKLKYPSLLAGAVASSAPLHVEENFEQYHELVAVAMTNPFVGGSEACSSTIKEGVTALRDLVVSTTPMGTDPSLPVALRPCTPIASADDLAAYELNISSVFYAVQGSRADYTPYNIIKAMCDAATNRTANQTALESFTAAMHAAYTLWIHPNPPPSCSASSWQDLIAQYSNTTADPSDEWNRRQWQWQKCNEFGWFHTSTGAGSLVKALSTLTVEQIGLERCRQEFGLSDEYTGPHAQWTNTNFGDRDLRAENVVLVHGSMDPWHTLGAVNASDPFFQSCVGSGPCPSQKLPSSAKLVFMENQSHVQDMLIWDTSVATAWAHQEIAASVAGFLA
jgi:pimeloyl-ACP methyl ester carboxylesterase